MTKSPYRGDERVIAHELWARPYAGGFESGFHMDDPDTSVRVNADEVPALVAWLREAYPEHFPDAAAPVASSVSDDALAAYERGVADALAFVRGGGRA